MCCGRLKKLTKEKFRAPAPPGNLIVERTDEGKHVKRRAPVAPKVKGAPVDEPCPLCGSVVLRIQTCCRSKYKCSRFPECEYKKTLPKNQ